MRVKALNAPLVIAAYIAVNFVDFINTVFVRLFFVKHGLVAYKVRLMKLFTEKLFVNIAVFGSGVVFAQQTEGAVNRGFRSFGEFFIKCRAAYFIGRKIFYGAERFCRRILKIPSLLKAAGRGYNTPRNQ